jgi:hypothetical protein
VCLLSVFHLQSKAVYLDASHVMIKGRALLLEVAADHHASTCLLAFVMQGHL